MKTTYQLKRCFILFGAGALLSGAVKSQGTTDKNQLHLKVSQETNGKKMVLDTFIEDAGTFDVDAFLKSRGFDAPATQGKGSASRVYIINEEDEGGTDKDKKGKKVIIKREVTRTSTSSGTTISDDGDDMPVPPIPPIPAEIASDPEKLKAFLKNDSFYKGAIMVMPSENDIEAISIGAGRKEMRVMMLKKVYIRELSDKDRQSAGGKSMGELKVEQLRFYPNPSDGRFRLSFETPVQKPVEVTIRNKDGKTVYNEKVRDFSGSYDKEIDLTQNGKGTYFLNVTQGKKLLQKKIVIE